MIGSNAFVRSFSLTFLTFLILAASWEVNAQFEPRLLIRDVARPPSSSGGGGRTVSRKPVVIQKVRNVVRTIREEVRVSNLSVVTQPGARVALEPLAKTARRIPPIVARASGSAIFESLAPGKYKVIASKDGFETQEQDEVVISPQRPHVLDMELRPISYKLKIQTNLPGGEVFYAPALLKGRGPNNSIISERLGNYCVVKIEKNGEATISDLVQGYYDIDIRPETLEFEQKLAFVNVPEDTEQDDEAVGVKTFEIDLQKKISTETFGSAWTRDEWIVPAGFRIDRGMKVNGSAGLALPANERFRYYTNFEMISDVKLLDGGTVGFALRAVSPQDYYLVLISGARAAEPHVAKVYTVRNGQENLLLSLPISHFALTLARRNGFRVIIKGDAKGFRITIEDSESGLSEAVGYVPDPYNTFQKGAIGIAARGRANFEVSNFQVCAASCR